MSVALVPDVPYPPRGLCCSPRPPCGARNDYWFKFQLPSWRCCMSVFGFVDLIVTFFTSLLPTCLAELKYESASSDLTYTDNFTVSAHVATRVYL